MSVTNPINGRAVRRPLDRSLFSKTITPYELCHNAFVQGYAEILIFFPPIVYTISLKAFAAT